MTRTFRGISMWALLSVGAYAACGNDNPPPPVTESTSQPCAVATDCYPGLEEAGALRGDRFCITKVQGGYCTHTCVADSDCCAVPGECRTSHPQVCAPFENMSAQKYCFLSCEDGDWADAGVASADAFCGAFAGTGFGCRSTGGGPMNRKICAPSP